MDRYPFAVRKSDIATSTSQTDIDGVTEQSRIMRCFDRLVGEAVGWTPTQVVFGFKAGSTEYIIGGVIPSINSQVCFLDEKVFVPGDYVPFVRFVGNGATYTCNFWYYGYTTWVF